MVYNVFYANLPISCLASRRTISTQFFVVNCYRHKLCTSLNLNLRGRILKMSSRGLTRMFWNDLLHTEHSVILVRQSGQVPCPFSHTATGAYSRFKHTGQLTSSVIFTNMSLNSVRVNFSCKQ